MTIHTLTPQQTLNQLRQRTLVSELTTDDLDVFDALHQLHILENYRGHQLCQERSTGSRWERLVQGAHPLPFGLTTAAWRTSVDKWIDQHPDLPRYGVVGDQDLVYCLWKTVLAELLVSRPNLTKMRKPERQVWPAITSPRPEQLRGYIAAISRSLNRAEELVPSEQLLIEILDEQGLIERDVLYYADLDTNEKIIYPGPFVRCQRKSANLLNRIAARYLRSKGAKRLATQAAAEFVVATARELGITVPHADVAFPHLYIK